MDIALIQHKEMASGRWATMSLAEQLGNVGSEVSRALNWKNKGRDEKSYKSLSLALELMDLTLQCKYSCVRLQEIARARETLVDYFVGNNIYNSTEKLLRSYFDYFALIARNRILRDRKNNVQK